jgi:eukaryotic-like serine/threonine-protein kinase
MSDSDSLVKPGMRIGSYTVVRRSGRAREAWIATGPGGESALVTLPTVRHDHAPWEPREPEVVLEAARMQAEVRHPNVVRIVEILDLEGVPVLVTDVMGPALAFLGRLYPLPSDDVADAIVRDVAAGLEAVHAAGLVHRNLRPANVVLSADVDRIVAKVDAVGLYDARPPLAPECIRGQSPDARSDVFALGVLACTVLTGEHPFKGVTDEEVAYATLSGRYGPLREIPDPMAAAIDGALRVDPRHRTASVRDFLALWTEGRPEPAPDLALLAAVKRYGSTSG